MLLATGAFSGAGDITLPPEERPDFGPADVDPRRGIATIGAVPWVVNYNVMLKTEDMKLARRIARSISSRGGGLPAVEAMALPHQHGECALVAALLTQHR